MAQKTYVIESSFKNMATNWGKKTKQMKSRGLLTKKIQKKIVEMVGAAAPRKGRREKCGEVRRSAAGTAQ